MNPPANWYPDPTGRHGQRYWDGQQWTEHVFTDGVQGVDPLEQATASSAEDPAGTEQTATEDAATEDPDGATGDGEERADDAAPGEVPGGEAASATGLFADAGSEDAWTPQDDDGGEAEDDTVAPDVEAEDVVASLDEMSDGTPSEVAAAVPEEDAPMDEGDAPMDEGDVPTDDEAPGDDEAPTDEDAPGDENGPPPGGDMSDAFVLAPETASRIVKRRAAEHAEATAQDDAPPATAAPAESAAPTATEEPPAADQPGATAGAIDAPPPTAAAPAPSMDAPPQTAPAASDGGGLGITGDLLGGAFAERSEAGPVALQNTRLLRCAVTPGEAVVARQGTMVAYQGEVSFERQGAGGVTRALKRAATGEGLAMMRAEGTGDVFFADGAQHVFLLELAGGPGLSVNGRNVLAFSAALQWDIERVKGASLLAGGLFNTTFTGNGWVALVSDGEPVVLHTDEAPTHVDVNALVAWSAGLSTRIVNSVSAKSLVGLGSGEAFQMAFDGPGIVIVQPSEGPMGGAAAT